MSGINLKEMDVSDMVDIIHFLFEEDNHFTSEESVKSRSGLRTTMYQDLYGTEYKYKPGNQPADSGRQYTHSYDPDSDGFGSMSGEDSLKPFNPKELATKGFIPSTQFDPTAASPFGSVLDAPFG